MGFFGGRFDLFFQRFIEVWSTLPLLFVVIIISATLRGIDVQIEQAAMSLGASRLTTLRRVVFPLVLPGILVLVGPGTVGSAQSLALNLLEISISHLSSKVLLIGNFLCKNLSARSSHVVMEPGSNQSVALSHKEKGNNRR